MDTYSGIKEKIRRIAGTEKLQQTTVFPAQVEKITGTTCTVKIDELLMNDVRLRAVINNENEQLLITPKVGSYVLIVDLSGGEYRDLAVISYSEIDKIELKISETTITTNANGITIENKGENLFKVLSDFITEVTKIIVIQGTSPNVAALNQIMQRLNKILR
ncbi:MAG: hypothetical protein LBT56_00475 [Prevotellaceae bacterium]|jgi:hypothetical protein|nr:hypothetical protein [Prevotellaceae bacterium]